MITAALPEPVQVTLLFGPIGAGKSTVAGAIAERTDAIVLASDVFFAELFLADMPQPPDMAWVLERVERCEARIRELTLQCVAVGTPVVLDVGLAVRAARDAFARWCQEEGLEHRFVFVTAPKAVRATRVEGRNARAAETGDLPVAPAIFEMTDARFEQPDGAELDALGAHVIENV